MHADLGRTLGPDVMNADRDRVLVKLLAAENVAQEEAIKEAIKEDLMERIFMSQEKPAWREEEDAQLRAYVAKLEAEIVPFIGNDGAPRSSRSITRRWTTPSGSTSTRTRRHSISRITRQGLTVVGQATSKGEKNVLKKTQSKRSAA